MDFDPNPIQSHGFQISHPNSTLLTQQHHHQELVPCNSGYGQVSVPVTSMANNSVASLLCGLSILKDRVHRVQSLVLTPLNLEQDANTMGRLIQEIIGTADSMRVYCQQLNHLTQDSSGIACPPPTTTDNNNHDKVINSNKGSMPESSHSELGSKSQPSERSLGSGGFEIIEVEAADLLAKYTHHCQICGKGFKRYANLRMHMRAHGEEYKSSAAHGHSMFGMTSGSKEGKKYSCPHEGCRWNKNHPKFHPLKSMICVKNHYKRSHCPKMYVCERCNGKRFSVQSDLRTHEKHCGDIKWRCSCGTTFSRKDKLMGHVRLFVGHAPVVVVRDGGIRRSAPAMRIGEAYDRG